MAKLKWDQPTERLYETGVKKAVLYPQADDGSYSNGVAWNGITAINENPSGAEPTPLYADDIKYLELYSAEEYGGTIEAYTYPKEWAACDGSKEVVTGVIIGQQNRQGFGLCYRTIIGNDAKGNDYGYKLHLIWGAKASPTERNHETVNDSPDVNPFSWEFSTTPVEITSVEGAKPTAVITVDSTTVDADKLKALEDVLYGTEGSSGVDPTEASLPTPDKVLEILGWVAPTP